ncbi:MAG TPA: phosphotransferase [Polyangiaceae bacterium]|nr:phosphotransferase [Polyangiaceae bacterium]
MEPLALAQRIQRATGAKSVTLGERVQALWGGYGELWRAELGESDAPTGVVVKHVQPPPDDGSRSHRRKLRSYEVEQAFYGLYAARCAEPPSCRVPRLLHASKPDGCALLVLEDLDAAGFSLRQTHASAAQVRATLRWLARFHARFLGATPDGLWKVGTYWQLATRPEELTTMKLAALRKAAPQIDAALNSARFKTFVHGDAKLENVCFSAAANDVALVDFQYVGGGVGVKDVAYFLSSCLLPGECAAAVPGYLADYFGELRSALAAGGSAADAEQLEREWRALFPLAWVDFYRFLLGWAPGQYDRDPYSEELARGVLARFRSA